ncbi:MAG: 50S ribosomal protein L21e [Candidatus Micrarchaeia archaeon]
MTMKSNGMLSKRTRNIARHHRPSSLGTRSQLKKFSIGDKVAIVPKGNYRDIPHPRYRGKIGKIIGQRGEAYIVEVNVMSAKRKLIVPSLHLEKV